MGLVKAFDAFDCERGVRFSTYAVPAILGEIKRMEKPTILKLTELYKNLPNDAYKEVRPICERLLKNGAIKLIWGDIKWKK